MISDLDKIHNKQGLRTSSFIDDLNAISTPDPDPEILQLWRGIELPDYLTNPAICASRFLDDGQQSEDGCFEVEIGLPNGDSIRERDVIRWTTPARGTLRHNTRFVKSVLSCDEDIGHYVKTVPHHCGKLSCPACAAYEISYNATQQGIKLMSGAKYAQNDDYNDGALQHVFVSPPKSEYYNFITWDGFQEMKKYAIKVATDAGLKGGMLIFHPYRQNGINEDDDLPDDYEIDPDNDGNPHHARFAPHFHILGFGFLNPASKDFEKQHKGWIYKASQGKNRPRTLSDIITRINYVMSHVGIISEDSPYQPARIQTISWFGRCNSHVLTYIGEIRLYEEKLCEECGHNIVVHAVKGYNEELQFQGNLYMYQKFPIYSDSAHKDEMADFFEENKLSPMEILQYIENHPEMGVCYLKSRDLDRKLSQPTVIYAKMDDSPHVPDVYCMAYVPAGITKKRLKRAMKKIDPEDSGGGFFPIEKIDPEDCRDDFPLTEMGILLKT